MIDRRDGDGDGLRRQDLVDSHHHLWRLADLPWLNGPVIPRIFGPYEAIQHDYLATDYTAEAVPSGVTDAVYVQANWPLERSLDEVRWLRDVHEATGWPSAVVGSADLFDEHAPDVLRAQAALTPLMRGTRLQLHWHQTRPEFRFADAPDRMHDPVLRRNIATLAELGWLFELQVFPAQAADAAAFVAAFPETTFVLVHAGMLVATDAATVAEWTAGLRRLAEQPNVVAKLSGQGTFVHRVDSSIIDLVAGTTIELFGGDRCMWGSNFPSRGSGPTFPPSSRPGAGRWRPTRRTHGRRPGRHRETGVRPHRRAARLATRACGRTTRFDH